MNLKEVNLELLHIDPNNSREHDTENIEMLCRSLKEYGQYKPLIVDIKTNVVLVGNGRLMAMKKMGWKTCHCLFIDKEDNIGLEIIDNRLNELSDWDKNEIKDWLEYEKGVDWWAVDIDLSKDILSSKKEKKAKKEKVDSGVESTVKPLCCPKCGGKLKKKLF